MPYIIYKIINVPGLVLYSIRACKWDLIYQNQKNYVTIPSISLYDCNAIHIDTMVSLLDTNVAEH